MTPLCRLQVLADIGRDRYLRNSELPGHDVMVEAAWSLYRDQFDGFTGAGLDPEFHRLAHPASARGSLRLSPETPVIVTGCGPSLARDAAALRRIRAGVHIFTSTRGAEALGALGIAPDVVIVEHASPLDALISVEHQLHRPGVAWPPAAVVIAEARTPAALLAGAPGARLCLPADAGFWGQWPATAVAWAAAGGARRIGLLGIDLGTPSGVAPESRPLASLLTLIAAIGGAACLDYGACGAAKPGWPMGSLEDLPTTGAPPIEVQKQPLPEAQFHEAARRWQAASSGMVTFARHALDAALAVRDGSSRDVAAVAEAAHTMLAWGEDGDLRLGIQDELGATFLPRLWRTGIDLRREARLWRPVVLALHEVVAQANRLDQVLARQPLRTVAHA